MTVHMKQGAPSKNVTPKKKRRRGQTDFSGTKAKRRKEARRRLLQASLLPSTPRELGVVDSDDGGLKSRKVCSINKLTLGSIDEGLEEDQTCRELGETLPVEWTDPMSDQKRRRQGDRSTRSEMNVLSWLDNNYNEGHFNIANDVLDIQSGDHRNEVK